MLIALQQIVEPQTAGDPMSDQKWVRLSLRQICRALAPRGYVCSPNTVGRLLQQLGYSLRANVKNAPARGHADRDEQFRYIAAYKQAFQAIAQPVISVDAKKAELIGNFKNAGRAWRKDDDLVDVHDFAQDATGRAIPYGMYDLTHNRGWVYVGTSANTPQFAVDAIAAWWQEDGQALFPTTTDLLILADGGGAMRAARGSGNSNCNTGAIRWGCA
jgi:Rhodopirellula transposase DDE domain